MRECQEDAPQFDLSSWRVENDCRKFILKLNLYESLLKSIAILRILFFYCFAQIF
jgi:hypothetical protein